MKRFTLASLILAASCGMSPPDAVRTETKTPSVQVAILLDTSNSMDGLIAQAKTQLWNIVNEFVRAKKDGKPPLIEVALFEYGKQSLPSEQGFVRQILPLTDDLDKVSEELFALKTNGGEEYCGWAIRDAVNRLEWSKSGDVYKAIFIAGNEPFTQGSVNYHEACKLAISRGILVNTIFCGVNIEGQKTGWKDGAVLADGRYMNIDQDIKVVEVPTPQDAEIARLGVDLNKTYLPFGRMGQAGVARQAAQDANAVNLSPSTLVSRSISKSNAFYCNDAWDLVDAVKNGKCKVEDLKDDDLPDDFKKLDVAGRKAKVAGAAKEREAIQAKILTLNKERDKFLAEAHKANAPVRQESLDRAITKAIRDQATRQHFTFE